MIRWLVHLALRWIVGARRVWQLWAALLLAIFAATGPPGLTAAERYNREVLESAVVAYAALRAINATLSTAKETTVGVELVGSVQGKPAMILDPVDETVARISGALFAVAGLSAVLAIAFAPAAQAGAALTAAGLVVLFAAPRLGGGGGGALRGVRAVTGLGAFLALALPLGYAGGGWLGAAVTDGRLAAAMERLDGERTEIASAVEDLSEEAAQPLPEEVQAPRTRPEREGEAGVMDRVFGNFSDTASSVAEAGRDALSGLRRQASEARASVPDMETVQARGGAIVQSGIDILAVYVVRLVVFPVLTLVVLWLFLRRAVGGA